MKEGFILRWWPDRVGKKRSQPRVHSRAAVLTSSLESRSSFKPNTLVSNGALCLKMAVLFGINQQQWMDIRSHPRYRKGAWGSAGQSRSSAADGAKTKEGLGSSVGRGAAGGVERRTAAGWHSRHLGPARQRSPRHATHYEPSFIESNATL